MSQGRDISESGKTNVLPEGERQEDTLRESPREGGLRAGQTIVLAGPKPSQNAVVPNEPSSSRYVADWARELKNQKRPLEAEEDEKQAERIEEEVKKQADFIRKEMRFEVDQMEERAHKLEMKMDDEYDRLKEENVALRRLLKSVQDRLTSLETVVEFLGGDRH